jgi:hypothetical protein
MQHISKDEWKKLIHVCKVHIHNPTLRYLYTKEWFDQNGCTDIYSADLQEDIIWLHSDMCRINEHPCSWIPYNLQFLFPLLSTQEMKTPLQIQIPFCMSCRECGPLHSGPVPKLKTSLFSVLHLFEISK